MLISRLAILAGALILGPMNMTEAMGRTSPLTVACRAESGKATLPDGICAAFEQEMAQAFPGRDVAQETPGRAAFVLVVESTGKSRLGARIDTPAGPGESRLAMLAGAPLDATDIRRFLAQLIAATLPR